MNQSTGRPFRIWSGFMIFAGIVCIALDVVLTIFRLRDPDISRFLLVLGAVFLLGCGIFEIAEGIRSIGYLNDSLLDQRFRYLNKYTQSFKRMTAAAVLLALAELVFSCIVGAALWQLAVMIVFGIFIPLINLLCIRSLQS